MENRINYNYAQINILNIVVSISSMWEALPEDHPLYDKMIPIRYYDTSLIGMRFAGYDNDGYGIFEPVEDETEEQTTDEPEKGDDE